MVTSTRVQPRVFADIFFDTGTLHRSDQSLTFKGTSYVKGVCSAGSLEWSIPLPSGALQFPTCTLEILDPDGSIKTAIDTTTPIRRLVQVYPELKAHSTDVSETEILFKGEVLGYSCPPGKVNLILRSITQVWMNRPIPHIATRDIFPNMPDDCNSFFLPFIYGRNYSFSETNVLPQGSILTQLVNTTTHDYAVARHACYSIPHVYRKRPLEEMFTLVDPSEYTTPVVDINWFGQTIHVQMIRFTLQQDDGTKIQCDVSGASSIYNWDTETTDTGIEMENAIDQLVNLIFITLDNEVDIERFDADAFTLALGRFDDRGWKSGGAITGKANSTEVITVGAAIAQVCSSWGIDFIQTPAGLIKVFLFDPDEDTATPIPVDGDLLIAGTVIPSAPREIVNEFRTRYFRDSAGLPDSVRDKGNREWAFENIIRNVTDRTELALTGSSPRLDKVIDLPFVRDLDMATDVTKRMMPYHSLRSYEVEFQVPGWTSDRFIGHYLYVGQTIAFTTPWGIDIGGSGWVDKLARINRMTFDLVQWKAVGTATVYWYVTDGDLDIQFDDHPVRDAQTRQPQFPVTINGTTPITAARGTNLNETTPTIPVGHVVVRWHEDVTDTGIRQVTASVPAADIGVGTTASDFIVMGDGSCNTYELVDATLQECLDVIGAALFCAESHIRFDSSSECALEGTNWADDYINDIYTYLCMTATGSCAPGGVHTITYLINDLYAKVCAGDDDSAYLTPDEADDLYLSIASFNSWIDDIYTLDITGIAASLSYIDGRVSSLCAWAACVNSYLNSAVEGGIGCGTPCTGG